jgi:hypothetical protein
MEEHMEHEEITPKPAIPFDKIVFGLVLVVIGVATFGAGIDLWDFRQLVRLWPLALIVIGLAGEVESLRKRKGDGSSFLLGAGVWMLFGTLHLFDLSIRTALPLGVIVVGLSTVIHALVDLPEAKEKDNESESV